MLEDCGGLRRETKKTEDELEKSQGEEEEGGSCAVVDHLERLNCCYWCEKATRDWR